MTMATAEEDLSHGLSPGISGEIDPDNPDVLQGFASERKTLSGGATAEASAYWSLVRCR